MWIGCLASYNNGRLHGEWADVSEDADENAAAIAKVLRSSPYPNVTRKDADTGEEYATAEEAYVADYDDTPGALANLLGEYPTADALAHAARLADLLADQWPDTQEADAALSVMLDGKGTSDLEDLADDFQDWVSDHFAGEGDTLAEWCSEFLADTGFFGDTFGASSAMSAAERRAAEDRLAVIERYFDFESYARDMVLGGDISAERVGGRVLVFWNR